MDQPSEDLDFFEQLSAAARDGGDVLIGKIIENAKAGDASSLKLLEKALHESRFAKEEKLKITDEQYQRIILLAAERIRGSKVT